MTIAIGEPFRFGSIKGALVCADSGLFRAGCPTTPGFILDAFWRVV
jgi:hypothetical protein